MCPSIGTDESGTAEVERAIDRIDSRAERIRERELERALSELDGLDSVEQVAVERLAERLTERLLDPPRQGLREAAERDDTDAIRVAQELFGV